MENLLLELKTLSVFRNILELPAMVALTEVLDDPGQPEALSAYAEMLYEIRRDGCANLSEFLENHLRYDDSAFGRMVAAGKPDKYYLAAARADVAILSKVAALDLKELKAVMADAAGEQEQAVIAGLPVLPKGRPISFRALTDSFRKNGVGLFARGRAFRWEKGELAVVRNPDPIDFCDMVGYQWQREEVIKNTRALHDGKPSNNVLLHGDSGTGKSATIKSLINMPEFFNLRIVEISKASLDELNDLVRLCSNHTQKFILYIDDLTFEQEDKGYSALKTALEGGLELRPFNVAIYVTSNRRHMIRESFGDRDGGDIHREETIQERTSLAERFGLRIAYLSLNKYEFLDTVRQLASHDGIRLDEATLQREANKWEIQHSGRTPRTARQFVDYLHTIM